VRRFCLSRKGAANAYHATLLESGGSPS